MKLVAHKRPASEKLDRLEYVRDDGTRSAIDMPRQGILPHDLIHYVVEQGFALRDGFLSLVAAGGDARYVMEMAHDAGNRDRAARAVQAEALVEALQTQLWAGAFDRERVSHPRARSAKCEVRSVTHGRGRPGAVRRA